MYSKTTDFDENLQETARFAKALSHPARLAIMRHLAQSKSCYSGNIADELPLSRTTVSQHLMELKRAGLIKGEIEGTKICYCINPDVFERCKTLLEEYFGEIGSLPWNDCNL